MKRNVAKAIAEYDALYEDNKRLTAFYPKELKELEAMTEDGFDLAIKAMKFGFICGYRAGSKQV